MLDAQTLLVFLRIILLICGMICVGLGYSAFRTMLASDADLRLKLGKDFSKSPWDIMPGLFLATLGALAVAIAYFLPPSM